VLADIGNSEGVRFMLLHGHDSPLDDKGFGDDKRVGAAAALIDLLQLDILLEMLDRENARNKSAFFGRWCCEDFLVSRRPFPK